MAYVRYSPVAVAWLALVTLALVLDPSRLIAADDSKAKPWAFLPIVRPELPVVEDSTRVRNPIDRFVQSRLEAEGLSLSRAADPRLLIRRMFRVMLGLPPSPERVAAHVASVEDTHSSGSEDRHAALIDEVLDSPRYGERWARHWLDVVRFAESTGFETNQTRPNAWPYRDWVIAAFNDDLPYDRFVLEQLAGDAVGVDAATGFLVAGPYDTVKSPDVVLTRTQRSDELADMVGAASTAFLGLTVACARCHDHKFDPIRQTDYYAMESIFAGVQHGERPNRPPGFGGSLEETERELKERVAEIAAVIGDALPGKLPAVNPRRNEERFSPVLASRVRFVIRETNDGAEPCFDEIEIYESLYGAETNAGSVAEEPAAAVDDPSSVDGASAADDLSPKNVALLAVSLRSSGDYLNNPKHKLVHLNDGEVGNGRSWISNTRGEGWVEIELPEPTMIDRVVWGRDRTQVYSDRLATQYEISIADADGAWIPVASSAGRLPGEVHLGDVPQSLLEELPFEVRDSIDSTLVEVAGLREERRKWLALPKAYAGRFTEPPPTRWLYRGDPMQERSEVTPNIPGVLGTLGMSVDVPEQQRRVALADWIGSPKNPLAARVIVNRIWMHHFGEGLVDTPSDFGRMGSAPSHPKLLDWLAIELIESGYRLKHIQRLILNSATWRQSSRPIRRALSVDRNGRLLWRFPPRRMEAEALRDSILSVAGTLDLTMGGPGFSVFLPNSNYVRVFTPKPALGPEEFRRTIYMTKIRMEQDAVFGAFDAPDGGLVCAKRSRSTTPLQAFNLWNSPRVMQQAERFVERVLEGEGGSVRGSISVAPTLIDRAYQLAFCRDPDREERAAATELVTDYGWVSLCRALLNTNEFAFIE